MNSADINPSFYSQDHSGKMFINYLLVTPYLVEMSVISLTLEKSLPASLAILTHSLIFALGLLNTNSAMTVATSFSIPSSRLKTCTAISTNSSKV